MNFGDIYDFLMVLNDEEFNNLMIGYVIIGNQTKEEFIKQCELIKQKNIEYFFIETTESEINKLKKEIDRIEEEEIKDDIEKIKKEKLIS